MRFSLALSTVAVAAFSVGANALVAPGPVVSAGASAVASASAKVPVASASAAASAAVASATSPAAGVIAALQRDLAVLNASVAVDVAAIEQAFATGAADVNNIIEAVVNNGAHILLAILQASEAVYESTDDLITTLSAPEIAALKSLIVLFQNFATTVSQDLSLIGSKLAGATELVLKQEIQAAINALKPFTDPLIAYANSVTAADKKAGAALVQDLKGAAAGLQQILTTLLAAAVGL